MPYSFGYFNFYDSTYILIIIAAVISLAASARVKSTFAKYSKVNGRRGITAEEAAADILHRAGIHDVKIGRIKGNMTDNYNPSTKVLSLSDSVYGSTSVAAIGVAAHECGHAIQDEQEYLPMRVRTAIVPVVNIGSRLSWPLILIGFLFSFGPLITVGIVLFSVVVVFQLVTLPVELNASGRALAVVDSSGLLDDNELKGAKKVLRAAAMTYIAAAAGSILQLLRLLLLSNRRRN